MARFIKGLPASVGDKAGKTGYEGRYAADREAFRARKRAEQSRSLKRALVPAPQPKGDPEWDKHVTWWWRALGKSDIAKVAEPGTWMQAWIAADILDHMYNYGFTAGLLKEFSAIAFTLSAPRLDLLDLQPESGSPGLDQDEAEAQAATSQLLDSLDDDNVIPLRAKDKK